MTQECTTQLGQLLAEAVARGVVSACAFVMALGVFYLIIDRAIKARR